MSNRSGYRPVSGLWVGLLAVLASVGCETNSDGFGALAANLPQEPPIDLAAPAGVPVSPSTPTIQPTDLARDREFGSRPDPFSLLDVEIVYDEAQRTEFFLSQVGGYTAPVNLESLAEVEVREVLEPVPAWRLSGVIIGNGVLALLDTGLAVHEIRPGSKVPDTEWTVVSIDSDRAVLRREGNKLPREFSVPLQGPIGGTRTVGGVGGVGGGLPGQGGAGAGRGRGDQGAGDR